MYRDRLETKSVGTSSARAMEQIALAGTLEHGIMYSPPRRARRGEGMVLCVPLVGMKNSPRKRIVRADDGIMYVHYALVGRHYDRCIQYTGSASVGSVVGRRKSSQYVHGRCCACREDMKLIDAFVFYLCSK